MLARRPMGERHRRPRRRASTTGLGCARIIFFAKGGRREMKSGAKPLKREFSFARRLEHRYMTSIAWRRDYESRTEALHHP